jgi:hypothetical protein
MSDTALGFVIVTANTGAVLLAVIVTAIAMIVIVAVVVVVIVAATAVAFVIMDMFAHDYLPSWEAA